MANNAGLLDGLGNYLRGAGKKPRMFDYSLFYRIRFRPRRNPPNPSSGIFDLSIGVAIGIATLVTLTPLAGAQVAPSPVARDPIHESAASCKSMSIPSVATARCFTVNWRPARNTLRRELDAAGGPANFTQSSSADADIRKFGAKCDDSANDTVAIQKAIDSLPASGGVISFPPNGKCKISATLHVNKPHVIFHGYSSRKFITADVPSSYIDFVGSNQNGISIDAQGFIMDSIGIKYPSGTGGPIAPDMAPHLSAVKGNLPAGSYYVETSCVNAIGESRFSQQAHIVLPGAGGISVAAPHCVGNGASAIGWQVYASTGSGNETRQNAATIPINAAQFVISAKLSNLGYRSTIDQTAACAIYDNNAGQYWNVTVFSDSSSPGLADGICLLWSSAQIDRHTFISGFHRGVSLRSSNNNVVISKSFFQNNAIAIQIAGGAEIHIEENDFEGNVLGDIEIFSGIVQISRNYFEQQKSGNIINYNVELGENSEPVIAGQAFAPTNAVVDDNFFQCNGMSGQSPILVQRVIGLKFNNNNITNCQNHSAPVVNNWRSPNAGIKMVGNVSSSNLASWISSPTGVEEYDWSNKAFKLGPRTISASGKPCQCPQ